jgi:hypothetical protein
MFAIPLSPMLAFRPASEAPAAGLTLTSQAAGRQ